MDHRAVLFSDRTYAGPVARKENEAELAKNKGLLKNGAVARPLMPYGSK